MATKERSTRETGACVRDCQSYRVKPFFQEDSSSLFTQAKRPLSPADRRQNTYPVSLFERVVGIFDHHIVDRDGTLL